MYALKDLAQVAASILTVEYTAGRSPTSVPFVVRDSQRLAICTIIE